MPYSTYESSASPSVPDWHTEYAIRERAYQLWEQAGRPEGADPSGSSWSEHFWLQAEAERIKSAETPGIPRNSVAFGKISPDI